MGDTSTANQIPPPAEREERKDTPSAVLLQRWCDGDQAAAAELYNRYAGRLVTRVRDELSQQFSQRFDPEDVALSAYKSLFCGARDGRYLLQRNGQLWPLLVQIALHKVKHWVREHLAQRRSVRKEQYLDSEQAPDVRQALRDEREPPAEAVAALSEEMQRLLDKLKPRDRLVVALKLEGYNEGEIARQLGCCVRTVRKVLRERVEPYLRQRLGGSGS